MTLQERKDILQQRLNNMTAQKVQIETALSQTIQAIQQITGALQTVEELLNESPTVRRSENGDNQEIGEQIGLDHEGRPVDQ